MRWEWNGNGLVRAGVPCNNGATTEQDGNAVFRGLVPLGLGGTWAFDYKEGFVAAGLASRSFRAADSAATADFLVCVDLLTGRTRLGAGLFDDRRPRQGTPLVDDCQRFIQGCTGHSRAEALGSKVSFRLAQGSTPEVKIGDGHIWQPLVPPEYRFECLSGDANAGGLFPYLMIGKGAKVSNVVFTPAGESRMFTPHS
jgi:hypothetical protein